MTSPGTQTPIVPQVAVEDDEPEEIDVEDVPEVDGSGGSSGGLPFPSISKRQFMLLVVVLVIGLVIWQIRRRGGAQSSSDDEERTQATGDGTLGGEAVPENTNDPLAADEAVIRGLKNEGVMGQPD